MCEVLGRFCLSLEVGLIPPLIQEWNCYFYLISKA